MNFGFTEEQELLRTEVRKLLDERCPLERVRELMATPDGFDRKLWNEMGELGWLGILIPEAHGGAGLAWVDWIVLLEETGRSLHPSPLISTTLVGSALVDLGDESQRARFLPALADGSCIGTVALPEAVNPSEAASGVITAERAGDSFVLSGERRYVPDAGVADLFVVAFHLAGATADLSLAVIERGPGVTTESYPTIDRTKRLGTLTLDGVRVSADRILGETAGASEAIARLLDCGAVAVTGEAIGAAEAALEITIGYAKDRIQFDRPIGQYQGVKHPLAEMYVDIESFKSLLYYAAWTLDESPGEAPLAAARAKAYATDAFPRLGIECIQLHGAVGYTDEFDIQLYLKRAKWVRPSYGDADYHYERVAELGGL